MTLDEFARSLDSRVRFLRSQRYHKVLLGPVKLIDARMAQRRARRHGRGTTRTAQTFFGQRMTVVLPDLVSEALYRYGFVEEGLTRMVMHFVKPGMTFFDVGAHCGYFTLLAATLVGKSGQVHSFEPTPSTVKTLRENVAGRPNVHVNHAAVFREETELAFNDFGPGFFAFNSIFAPRLNDEQQTRTEPVKHQVQAITLDGYCARTGARPDFVKIDAESAELDIIRGAAHTLKNVRPLVSTEVGDFAIAGVAESNEIVSTLAQMGYRPAEWRNGRIVRHDTGKSYKNDNLLFVPDEHLATLGIG